MSSTSLHPAPLMIFRYAHTHTHVIHNAHVHTKTHCAHTHTHTHAFTYAPTHKTSSDTIVCLISFHTFLISNSYRANTHAPKSANTQVRAYVYFDDWNLFLKHTRTRTRIRTCTRTQTHTLTRESQSTHLKNKTRSLYPKAHTDTHCCSVLQCVAVCCAHLKNKPWRHKHTNSHTIIKWIHFFKIRTQSPHVHAHTYTHIPPRKEPNQSNLTKQKSTHMDTNTNAHTPRREEHNQPTLETHTNTHTYTYTHTLTRETQPIHSNN